MEQTDWSWALSSLHEKETKQSKRYSPVSSFKPAHYLLGVHPPYTSIHPPVQGITKSACFCRSRGLPVTSSVLSALRGAVFVPIASLLSWTLSGHLNHADFAAGLESWYRILKTGQIKILACQHFPNIWSSEFPSICSQMLLIINLRTVCQHDCILNFSASCELMYL